MINTPRSFVRALPCIMFMLSAGSAHSGTLLDFEAGAPTPCVDGAAYMAGFGITVTGSATARICIGPPNGNGGAIPFSGANLLLLDTPLPTNSTYTFAFVFDNPVNNVSFVRTQIRTPSTGPAWLATALSSSDVVLSTTGEGTTFAPSAQLFSLPGEGIKTIRFDTDNTSASTYNVPPIDDLQFAAIPEPSSLSLVALASLLMLFRKKLLFL